MLQGYSKVLEPSPVKYASLNIGQGAKHSGFTNGAGHLFSYNEIREHKKLLTSSLRKQTNKFLEKQI